MKPESHLSLIQRLNQRFVQRGETLSQSVFVRLQLLGSGSFAEVYKVRSLTTRVEYAMKVIPLEENASLAATEKKLGEISLHASCSHENIISVFAAWAEEANVYLIMELAEQTLYDYLLTRGKLPSTEVVDVLADVTKAIGYLHSLTPPVVHRDIKPENVFISGGRFKLGDMGTAACTSEFRDSLCGTVDYFAPEMIQGGGHGTALDMWSLGVLAYELVEGRPPFRPEVGFATVEMTVQLTQKNILAGKIEFGLGWPSDLHQAVTALLSDIPEQRPTANQLLDALGPASNARSRIFTWRNARLSQRVTLSSFHEVEAGSQNSDELLESRLLTLLQIQHLKSEKQRLQSIVQELTVQNRLTVLAAANDLEKENTRLREKIAQDEINIKNLLARVFEKSKENDTLRDELAHISLASKNSLFPKSLSVDHSKPMRDSLSTATPTASTDAMIVGVSPYSRLRHTREAHHQRSLSTSSAKHHHLSDGNFKASSLCEVSVTRYVKVVNPDHSRFVRADTYLALSAHK